MYYPKTYDHALNQMLSCRNCFYSGSLEAMYVDNAVSDAEKSFLQWRSLDVMMYPACEYGQCSWAAD